MPLPLRCALRDMNSQADIANVRWHTGLPVHPVLLGILGASLIGNLLTRGKGIVRAGEGVTRAGERIEKNKLNSLLPFHPLTNFEISEYYINEPRFNGVDSRNNLPKAIKEGTYVINLDEYENMATQWIAIFVKPKYTVYFHSFGKEHIPEETCYW